MPELPEVETIRRGLLGHVLERDIVAVRLSRTGLIRDIAPKRFVAALKGNRFLDVVRKGKYLAFPLRAGGAMVAHLRMTGRLVVGKGKGGDLVITFSDGTELRFEDRRRLAVVTLVGPTVWGGSGEFLSLGPEPFSSEFTAEWLAARLNRSRREVKTFLIDQKIISGLGNIYSNEALFRAGVHPQTRCDRLSLPKARRLWAAVREVLGEALSHRGTSFSDYVDVNGDEGGFQRHLYVYRREGEPCRRCGSTIRRVRHRGRSSFYCPGCQPRGREGL